MVHDHKTFSSILVQYTVEVGLTGLMGSMLGCGSFALLTVSCFIVTTLGCVMLETPGDQDKATKCYFLVLADVVNNH